MSLDNSANSPMMIQYRKIKEQYRDSLLFYRMGEFYEMFFDDAVAASEALDIALTKRGKTATQDIPMCGVPVHAADSYVQKLIRKGFRVAICEQTEDPAAARKRGSKSVVLRDVVRVMTPGTLTEDSLLDARSHNYLAAVAVVRGDWAVAWSDISAGDFHAMPCTTVSLGPQLARIAPGEIIIAENLDAGTTGVLEEFGDSLTPLSPIHFDSAAGRQRVLEHFRVQSLQAFGEFTRPEHSAMGAIVSYLQLTQRGNLPLLRPPVRERAGRAMQIDAATRRNLEISRDFSGSRTNSLLGVVDRTRTAAGARLLGRRISAPSTDLDEISQRLAAVEWFVSRTATRGELRGELARLPDINRALSRLSAGRAGPRDLAAIRNGLARASLIGRILPVDEMPAGLAGPAASLNSQEDLCDLLGRAIVAEPPFQTREGGFVAAGYHADLDEERRLRDRGRSIIAELQTEYAGETGIQSLKIKHNNVLGYFIEIRPAFGERMLSEPHSARFFHRQTTASAIRFSTSRLAEIESRMLNADQRIAEIELRIFDELGDRVIETAAALIEIAEALAELDIASAMAELAVGESWTRPVVDDSGILKIVGGRHPVVEKSLQSSGGQQFVANDCRLAAPEDSPRIRLVTGPNMSGKSTYLRQNALIVLLAQAGSFVPAQSARVGLVSQLFSRVGAADELARGRSTFMVEMVETAAILNQADQQALVILDEIGRGTATYAELSIAWATLEHLHEINGCRTLFATHYHELTQLAGRLDRIANSTVSVREWEGEVVFLHEVRDGSADRSYGIQVARLAGVPIAVVARAQEILEKLEHGKDSDRHRAAAMLDDLPLFQEVQNPSRRAAITQSSAVENRLRAAMPDELSPRDALQLIYELREMLK